MPWCDETSPKACQLQQLRGLYPADCSVPNAPPSVSGTPPPPPSIVDASPRPPASISVPPAPTPNTLAAPPQQPAARLLDPWSYLASAAARPLAWPPEAAAGHDPLHGGTSPPAVRPAAPQLPRVAPWASSEHIPLVVDPSSSPTLTLDVGDPRPSPLPGPTSAAHPRARESGSTPPRPRPLWPESSSRLPPLPSTLLELLPVLLRGPPPASAGHGTWRPGSTGSTLGCGAFGRDPWAKDLA
mmetsp:Transcript_1449/g.3287  ORF Transcript_1449/g.3287 Transcript_1449/m.3287 type:complete len:242 (+) Transcript_1449:2268-2993(+)